jgi:glycosyltransferase involved in cell wall biosynthesis
MTLSVVFIYRNSIADLPPALASVKWADEIIGIETGSTDGSTQLMLRHKARVVHSDKYGFHHWRNLGLAHATSDWLLYLDTDERLTPELISEIKRTIKSAKHTAYTISRFEYLHGKYLEHWPDSRVIRLFRRDALVKWTGKVHEQPTYAGTLGDLGNPMLHLTHKDITTNLAKTSAWSDIESDLLLRAKHPPMVGWRFFRIILTEFFGRFFVQGLWRDGTEGVIESIYQSFSRFITYLRLWEKQRNPSLSDTYKQIDKDLVKELEKYYEKSFTL